MAIKSLKCFQKVKWPLKFSKFSHDSYYQCTLHVEIFWSRKRKLSAVRHQTCIVPSRNHEPSSELLRFVRGVFPNVCQTWQFLYHTILVAWHYINQGFMCFWSFFYVFNWNDMSFHAYVCMCPCCETNTHMELTHTQVHKNMIFQTILVRRCM